MSFDDEGDPVRPEPKEAAELIVNWLSSQQLDALDDVDSREILVNGIERILTDGTAYCHQCSLAGGADRAIYHEPPICK